MANDHNEGDVVYDILMAGGSPFLDVINDDDGTFYVLRFQSMQYRIILPIGDKDDFHRIFAEFLQDVQDHLRST